jgi:hypothetical protein
MSEYEQSDSSESFPKTVIFDVDGTLALRVDREPFDWSQVVLDRPNNPIIEILRMFSRQQIRIVYVSGRPEKTRRDTKKWLDKHCGVDGELFMRGDLDNRKDSIVKREIYESKIKVGHDVICVFDDRNQVVRMWRDELGLICLQVADGDF